MSTENLLVTGATGMVGLAVVRRAVDAGYNVQAMVRPSSDRSVLAGLPVTFVEGDLAELETLPAALAEADVVVHAAAHIGDWGPVEKFRAANVVALEHMLTAVERQGRLRRWIQISSLGAYPARHHYGTDETTPRAAEGLDGYTQTKAEAEAVLEHHFQEHGFPVVILRPGFIYGAGERYAVRRMIDKLQAGKMKFIGRGDRLMNNTYVENLVDAVFLALDRPGIEGQAYNIRDGRLVTRLEFVNTVADYMGKPHPGHVPEWLARLIVRPIERFARLTGKQSAPLLTGATIKYMTYNLEFSIEKAQRELGYQPKIDFQEGIRVTLDDMVGGRST